MQGLVAYMAKPVCLQMEYHGQSENILYNQDSFVLARRKARETPGEFARAS